MDPSDFFQNDDDIDAFMAMGKMGLAVYRAVILAGGSEVEAFSVTAAFFAGQTKAFQSDEGERGGSEQ